MIKAGKREKGIKRKTYFLKTIICNIRIGIKIYFFAKWDSNYFKKKLIECFHKKYTIPKARFILIISTCALFGIF